MVQGYYSLEEAAKILGMTTEELTQLAQKREVRAFADRGTWRFRTQDVEELARRRGLGSSVELPVPELPPAGKGEASVFAFDTSGESDRVEIGQEMLAESPSSARKAGGSKAKTPTPRAGSDSDVRLVAEGGAVSFKLAGDSDVKVPGQTGGPKSGPRKVPTKPASDSDVKIVGDSSDEIALGGKPSKTGTDSDVRLDVRAGKAAKSPDDTFLTEEIDLDAEMRKAAEKDSGSKHKAIPTATGPIELSDADLERSSAGETDSSDFDLSLDVRDDSSPLENPTEAMPTVQSRKKAEEVPLGQKPKGVSGSDSGISLAKPADSGVSLEKKKKDSDDNAIPFKIAGEAEKTPKPVKGAGASGKTPKPVKAAEQVAADSSSEFELTLEDSAGESGGLTPLEESKEKDIFETDFEVPALEDSGSDAVKLDDTDLESSDFDLALGEEDVAAEDESGSQVVALDDEEDVDEGAATVARPASLVSKLGKGKKTIDTSESEDEGELVAAQEAEEEEVAAAPRTVAAAAAAPADWGTLTPIVLLLSVVVFLVVGMMSFELVRGMWGYRQMTSPGNLVIRSIGGLFDDNIKNLDE